MQVHIHTYHLLAKKATQNVNISSTDLSTRSRPAYTPCGYLPYMRVFEFKPHALIQCRVCRISGTPCILYSVFMIIARIPSLPDGRILRYKDRELHSPYLP